MQICSTDGLYASIAGTGALGPFFPADVSASPAEQAREVFRRIETVLAARGMSWGDVVRTWFYLDGIFTWYSGFNSVRTSYFAEKNIVPPPASTGIGLKTGEGELCAFVLASKEPWSPVESPLQVPATSYRSSFSRAAESRGTLYVSGTASILPGSSEVAFPGDFAAQTGCALDAVSAILESRGCGWRDCTRAIVYCKDRDGIPAARAAVAARGLDLSKTLFLQADVCREDWLFEIEADAAMRSQ